MDAAFISHMMRRQLGSIKELLRKLFGELAYPMITECLLQEAKSDSSVRKDVIRFMGTFERAPCGHEQQKKSGYECLKETLKEPKYCVAARAVWVINMCAYIPHVPLLAWDQGNHLVLRNPNERTKEAMEKAHEAHRIHASDLEKQLTLEALRIQKQERVEANKDKTARVKHILAYKYKTKAKGAHPLSRRKKTAGPKVGNLRLVELVPSTANRAEEGADTEPILISRSKLRRKRQRAEISEMKELLRKVQEKAESSAPTSEIAPQDSNLEHDDQLSMEPPRKKVRRRRKPRSASNSMDGVEFTSAPHEDTMEQSTESTQLSDLQ